VSYVDTFTRRELFRRLGRAAIAGPLVLATREQQADLILGLSARFGARSVIGQWLKRLWWWWL
jgi:hypothetical protein